MPLDSAARAYFAADSGVLVTVVRMGSPADRGGLVPGDVIVAANGASVQSGRPLMLDSTAAETTSVRLRRGTKLTTVIIARADTDAAARRSSKAGITVVDGTAVSGTVIDAVRPGSAGSVAGLRAGDRLLQVDHAPVTNAATAHRLLDRLDLSKRAAFIVFTRDSMHVGVLLRP
jgi:S1-C subfamily serine protease